jgi:hypothetical protein
MKARPERVNRRESPEPERPIRNSVAAYDSWLRSQIKVVEVDLRLKREIMRESAFVFLRGTFFRWAETIEAICPDLVDAPEVLAVGDSHVENFGVWRDAEGRLIWGVNDFDEAARMPYAFDLVRLAASASLARAGEDIKVRDICAAILTGYRAHLAAPSPFVLDEGHAWMRDIAMATPERRTKFWREIEELPDCLVPIEYASRLRAALPPGTKELRFAARVSGVGSLGRPRYVAVAHWRGGGIVREAKALVPSAWNAFRGRPSTRSYYVEPAAGPHRSPDPFLSAEKGILVRRLAPDSRKLDLNRAGSGLELRMLEAMGAELANVHAASTKSVRPIGDDLAGRDAGWLRDAARAAARAVEADFKAWKDGGD